MTPSTPPHRSRLPILLIAAGGAFLVGLILVAALFGSDRAPDEADTARQGQAVYDSSCAGCHGDRGQGGGVATAPPLDSSGAVWQLSPAALRALVAGGTHEGMPAFGQRLSEAEVEAVVNTIQTWWTAEQRQTHTGASTTSGQSGG